MQTGGMSGLDHRDVERALLGAGWSPGGAGDWAIALRSPDLFYADGPHLYETAAADPDRVVALIPEAERRFMTEIPLAASGPWDPAARAAMRAALAAADARRAARHG